MSEIAAFLGLAILLGSLLFAAIAGIQLAVIGAGFVLLGVFLRIGDVKKYMVTRDLEDAPTHTVGNSERRYGPLTDAEIEAFRNRTKA